MKELLKTLGKMILIISPPLLFILIAWVLTLGQQFDLLQVVISEDYLTIMCSLAAMTFSFFFLEWIYKRI